MLVPLVLEGDDVMLHAGALAIDERAWVVVGRSGAGKSTLLHSAHLRYLDVLCDDAVIIREGHVLAGPRCLDLRYHAPGSQQVRGDRHRLTLGPVPWRMPLAGFVHLRWSEAPGQPRMTELSPAERLSALVDEERCDADPSQAVELLDLAAYPAFALSRRRGGDVNEATELLERSLDAV